MNGAGFSPDKGEQVVGTPDEFLKAVILRFGSLGFDLACDGRNNVLELPGFTPEDDALKRSWPVDDLWNWLNPPFKKSNLFTAKAHEEGQRGAKTLVLVRAAIGSEWFAENVEGKALVVPIRGRLMFKGHDKNYAADLILLVYGLHGLVGTQPPWDWRETIREHEGKKKAH